MKMKQFYVNHPGGREYFGADELKQANLFAQRLANETGKTITRRDVYGGHDVLFYPAFPPAKKRDLAFEVASGLHNGK